MKNIVMVGTSYLFFDLIERLQKEQKINLIHWFFKNPKDDKEIEEAQKAPFMPKDETYERVYKNISFFLDTYARIRVTQGKSYSELVNMFALLYNFVFSKLNQKIDYILFTNIPHNGIDYLVYLVAKELNIKTILFYNNPLFADRFFYIYDIEDFGKFEAIESKKSITRDVEKQFKKDSVVKKGAKVENRRHRCFVNMLSRFSKMLFNRRQHTSLADIISSFNKCQNYKKHLKSAVTKVNFDKKFVYFALHLQPELHTSTLGKIYNDQILAIEQLSTLLPNDWYIYVKDHPQQIFYQRDEYFFARLKQIPNTLYLSSDISTYELMSKAKFISTITGTVGWEAISGGKNALVFGSPWYLSLNGVFKYSPNLKLEHILNYKIEHRLLTKNYNLLLEKSRKGTTNADYVNFVKDFSIEQNSEFLREFLKEEILQ